MESSAAGTEAMNHRDKKKLHVKGNDEPLLLDASPTAANIPDLKAIYKAEFDEIKRQLTAEHYHDLLDRAKSEAARELLKEKDRQNKRVEEALADIKLQREALENVLDELVSALGDVHRQVEPLTVMLVNECIYNIVGRNKNYQELIVETVKTAVSRIESEDRIEVRMSNSDYRLLKDLALEDRRVRLIADSAFGSGEFYVKVGFSVLEAGLIQQLDEARSRLVKQLGKTDEN